MCILSLTPDSGVIDPVRGEEGCRRERFLRRLEMTDQDLIAGFLDGDRDATQTVLGWIRGSAKDGGIKDILPQDGNPAQARMFGLAPSGLWYHNLASINDYYRELFPLIAESASRHGGGLGEFNEITAAWDRRFRKFSWNTVLARMLLPALSKTYAKTVRGQAVLDLQVTACALERHKLETGRYPQSVEILVPKYLAKTPIDPADGKPLRYKLEADGYYTLYSIGTDQSDGGGIISLNQKGTGVHPDRGDWVWSLKVEG